MRNSPWNQYPLSPGPCARGNQLPSINVYAMKPVDPTLKNPSVVLAGGVCIVAVLGRILSPWSSGCIYPIRGFWLSTLLNVPLLCLWCGMLVRYRIGRPKAWFLGEFRIQI